MVMPQRSVQDSGMLRPRRLLSAFLKFRRRAGKPVEVFDAARMKRMLQSGQPDDAHYYLERFLPFSGADWSQLSTELFAKVGVFKTLTKVAAGGEEGARIASLFANRGDEWLDSPDSIVLHKIIALMHGDRDRAPMLWQKLKQEGLNSIMDLVVRCPELQGQVRMPRRRPVQWDAAPHRVRQCPSHRRKTTNHTPSKVLLHEFLRRRLLTNHGRNRSGVSFTSVLRHTPHTRAGSAKPSGILSSASNTAAASEECGGSCIGRVEKQAMA